MTQAQTFDLNAIQFVYNQQGQPTSVIVPFKIFSRLLPQKISLDSLLRESAQTAKKEKIKLRQLLSTLKEARKDLYQENYL